MRYVYDPKQDKVVPRGERVVTASLQVVPDIKGYVSHGRMVIGEDGKPRKVWVDGRRARREDLKRSGCREMDPSEFREIQKEGERRTAERQEARQAVQRLNIDFRRG